LRTKFGAFDFVGRSRHATPERLRDNRRFRDSGAIYEPGTRILRSAQLLRSATVKRSRNGLALGLLRRHLP